MANTARNPALRRPDGSYAPAWQLADASLERTQRSSSSSSSSSSGGSGGGGGGSSSEAATAPPEPTDVAASGQAKSDGAADVAGSGFTASGRAKSDVAERLVASTAALLVVGDEILGGKQQDGNTYTAAQRLRAAGVPLKRVVVVADDMIEIVSELSRLVERYDVVLTSGGLGPTHDDITIKAVARALGVSLTRSEELAKTILDRYDDSGQVCVHIPYTCIYHTHAYTIRPGFCSPRPLLEKR